MVDNIPRQIKSRIQPSLTRWLIVSFLYLSSCGDSSRPITKRFIQVSEANSAYFSIGDDSPYVPIGINMINPSSDSHPDSSFLEIEGWMKNLSENGGNYIRVWLSESFWDIEEQAGKYSEEKAKRIDRFIEMARKYKLRIKLTLEHFRSITLKENSQPWATKFAYHRSNGGPLDSIHQYLTSPEGQQLFLNKIDFYKKRYGADTLFFGWELWNEMNAMVGPEDSVFFDWNRKMLSEVKQRFSDNLVMQSLGSFDGEYARPVYKKMMSLPGNEVAQVHRYLDLGASWDVCHGPMDIICSSAIDELISYHAGKPVILAETGAVEPHHAGPSKYYTLDTAGILLHDILFAPFFSGSAGAGMSWHWESYVAKNNLWYHFHRFNRAIESINPINEAFVPYRLDLPDFRGYVLKGNQTTLIWLRDKGSNWMTELEKHTPPPTRHEVKLSFNVIGIKPSEKIDVYDPWKDSWTSVSKHDDAFVLPDFQRSIVVRIRSASR